MTAVKRVDLRLQTPTVKGDKIRPKPRLRAPNTPAKNCIQIKEKCFLHKDIF